MTAKELKQYLKDHLVPSKLYKIGGHHKNRICMDKTKEGWCIFFQDKKGPVGTESFPDEASACRRMKEEIRILMEQIYGVTWVLPE